MVPSRIVILSHLPKTPNGKLDRKALPEPDAPDSASAGFVAPTTEAETALAAIWADTLGLTQVSVTQNFFEIGGDSITAIQVVSAIRKRFAHALPVRLFFESGTIQALAAELTRTPAPALEQSDLSALLDTLDTLELADD